MKSKAWKEVSTDTPDTWAGVWVQFGNGATVRKTDIQGYEPWDATHSVIYMLANKQEFLVKESVAEIDGLLDRSTVTQLSKCEACLNEADCEGC